MSRTVCASKRTGNCVSVSLKRQFARTNPVKTSVNNASSFFSVKNLLWTSFFTVKNLCERLIGRRGNSAHYHRQQYWGFSETTRRKPPKQEQQQEAIDWLKSSTTGCTLLHVPDDYAIRVEIQALADFSELTRMDPRGMTTTFVMVLLPVLYQMKSNNRPANSNCWKHCHCFFASILLVWRSFILRCFVRKISLLFMTDLYTL